MRKWALLLAVCVTAGQAERYLLITSHSPDRVAIVDSAGKAVWEYAIHHPQDAAVLPDGSVLCSELTGAQRISRDKQVLWRYKVPAGAQNPVAQPLPGGLVLVGNEGPAKLLEVDADNQVKREVQLTTRFKGNHGQFRFVRKTAAGTYLCPLYGDGRVAEFDAAGQQLAEWKVPNPVSALRLPDGHTLVGSALGVTEYDGDKLVWRFAPTDVPAPDKLAVVTALVRLKNGHTLFAHYTGDDQVADVFEVDREKRIVWKLAVPGVRNVAMIQLLDDHQLPSDEVLVR